MNRKRITSVDDDQQSDGDADMLSDRAWRLDKRIPAALLVALAIQTSGAIWWASGISQRVTTLETQTVSVAPLRELVVELRAKQDWMKEALDEIKVLLRQPRSTTGG